MTIIALKWAFNILPEMKWKGNELMMNKTSLFVYAECVVKIFASWQIMYTLQVGSKYNLK